MSQGYWKEIDKIEEQLGQKNEQLPKKKSIFAIFLER
jgi:hypothetical protein